MYAYYTRRIILKLFKINLWHQSNFKNRDYAKFIVENANINFKNAYLFDIGCGLAEVSSRIPCKKRFLIDTDSNIIFFLRTKYWIHRIFRKVEVHSKLQDNLLPSKKEKVLFLILNFTHNLDFHNLQKLIDMCMNTTSNYVIYIDTINHENYKFDHSKVLNSKYSHVSIKNMGTFRNGRSLWSLKPKKAK